MVNEIEFWNRIAPREEVDLDDEFINRQLRWREIERNLDGVETILDIGWMRLAEWVPQVTYDQGFYAQ